MSLPREGSRDTGEGIIRSIYPDVCLTPRGGSVVPVPYNLVAYQDVDPANMATSVRQTSLSSHVETSLVTQSFGDEPGTAGGVVSGTTGKTCEPKTWSDTVRAELRRMVRHDDEWWMNNKNTVGRLAYVKDTAEYPGPPERRVTPDIKTMSDAQPDPIRPGQVYARNFTPLDPMNPASRLREPSPQIDETPEEYQRRELEDQSGRLGGMLGAAVAGAAVYYWLRTTKKKQEEQCPCIVGTYNGAQDGILEKCKEADCKGQAHHIVADKYLGLGNRAQRIAGQDRIKGMPSFDDGPAICLNGHAGSEDADHNIAHQNDGRIEDLGNKNDPKGTLPIGVIRTLSVAAAKAAGPQDPDCQRRIESATGIDKYGGSEGALVRSSNMPPAEGSPAMNYFKPQKPIE